LLAAFLKTLLGQPPYIIYRKDFFKQKFNPLIFARQQIWKLM